MIKIIKGKIEEVESKVNEFMKEKEKDLPVRTNIDRDNNYIATVFYNRHFEEIPQKVTEEDIVDTEEETKKKSGDLGALWIQKDGSIKGKMDGKSIAFIDKKSMLEKFREVESKSGKKMLEGEWLDTKIRILKNEFKTKEIHPDFKIFGRT